MVQPVALEKKMLLFHIVSSMLDKNVHFHPFELANGKLKAYRGYMDKYVSVRVVMPKKPISHQITSGALVHHNNPPPGL